MATANTTSSTRKQAAPKGATPAPAFNPSAINPLIVDGSPEDTILGVSEVIAFLSGAMEHAEHAGDTIPLDGGCTGLARILDTCRAALVFHRSEGGAA